MTKVVCINANIVANVLSNSDPNSSFQQLWSGWKTNGKITVAPTLLLYEICNVLHRLVLAERITLAESEQLLEVALNLACIA